METLSICTFAVGHGDSTLVRIESPALQATYHLLVDGGEHMPVGLEKRLGGQPIDLMVLSHVDADHLTGLIEVASRVRVKEYWGPYLSVFERYAWLFPQRLQSALQRGRELEQKLDAQKTQLRYPLEGYTVTALDGRLSIEVFSPPPRLIERLLFATTFEQVVELWTKNPTPLKWLLGSEEEPSANDDFNAPRHELRVAVSVPPNLSHPSNRVEDERFASAASRSELEREMDLEPEFFGNPVLNNTSLVLRLTVRLDDTHYRRVLFTGDLENWVYLMGRHPGSIECDFLKAPHHGSRVYMEKNSEVALDELATWLRPRHVLVSANGRHKLPRIAFRDAWSRVGANVFCTNQRTREWLRETEQQPSGDDGARGVCCHAHFECGAQRQADIAIEVSAHEEHADRPACVQGFRGAGVTPVVVLRQHVIEPDDVLSRYTQGELERMLRWVVSTLRELDAARSAPAPAGEAAQWTAPWPGSVMPVERATLIAKARLEASPRWQFVADPEPVLRYGERVGKLWLGKSGRDGATPYVYRAPDRDTVRGVCTWACSLEGVLLQLRRDADVEHVSHFELLANRNLLALKLLIERTFGVPLAVVQDCLLGPVIEAWQGAGWRFYTTSDNDDYSVWNRPRWRLLLVLPPQYRVDHLPSVCHDDQLFEDLSKLAATQNMEGKVLAKFCALIADRFVVGEPEGSAYSHTDLKLRETIANAYAEHRRSWSSKREAASYASVLSQREWRAL